MKAHGPAQERGDDVCLVVVAQTEQKIAVFGRGLPENRRLSSVAAEKAAVQLAGDLFDLFLTDLYNDHLVPLGDQLFGRFYDGRIDT